MLLQLSTNMCIKGHNQLNVAFIGLQDLQEVQDIVDLLLNNRIGSHKGADAHVLADSSPIGQNGIHAKGAAAWLAKLEMFAVCYDNLVLRGLVETEFRDSRHVLLLPSVLQLVERARREVTGVILLHQEFVGCVGDHVLNFGVQNGLHVGVQSNGSSVFSDNAGLG